MLNESKKNDIHFKMKIYICLSSNIRSQCFLNKRTFESIRDVLFVQEGICERIKKIKLFFLIFKRVVKRSHSEACCLKNAHYPIFICLILYFGIKKSGKKK